MSHILVDMDGVLCDWGATYDDTLRCFGPLADGVPRHTEQTSFNLFENMNEQQAKVIQATMRMMSYSALGVIPGGPEALASMVEFGHEVMLCTSPWLDNPTCIKGKFEWVEQHLGPEWVDKVVITKDKTVVNGDWLVDDKPSITGYQQQPAWTHILFDQPYNQYVTGQPRLMSWDDWDNERFK